MSYKSRRHLGLRHLALLTRAVDAVESDVAAAVKTATQRPERGELGPSLIYIVRRPLDVAAVSDADDGSAVAASAPALRW